MCNKNNMEIRKFRIKDIVIHRSFKDFFFFERKQTLKLRFIDL